MPEYLNGRCCMCPKRGSSSQICPPSPVLHPKATPCRFVKRYVDGRGWRFRVMSGLGVDSYKARYQKPDKRGSDGWRCVKTLPWRKSFDEAQADLNTYAKERGWEEAEW